VQPARRVVVTARPAAASSGQLPRTGGLSLIGAALLGLSAGPLLIAGGLLARRIFR
jgi:LPXTG-motif cell wall-anchored protein